MSLEVLEKTVVKKQPVKNYTAENKHKSAGVNTCSKVENLLAPVNKQCSNIQCTYTACTYSNNMLTSNTVIVISVLYARAID